MKKAFVVIVHVECTDDVTGEKILSYIEPEFDNIANEFKIHKKLFQEHGLQEGQEYDEFLHNQLLDIQIISFEEIPS